MLEIRNNLNGEKNKDRYIRFLWRQLVSIIHQHKNIEKGNQAICLV